MSLGLILGICCLFFTLVVVVCHASVITYHTVKNAKDKQTKNQVAQKKTDLINTIEALKQMGIVDIKKAESVINELNKDGMTKVVL